MPSSGGYTGGTSVPTKTPQQIRREREEKDLREAADDANDRGVEFYKQRNWDKAMECFKEALDYDPDYEVAKFNLEKTKQNKIEFGRRLTSIEEHGKISKTFTNEPSSEEARKGFDTPTNDGPPLVYGGGEWKSPKDPVVPPSKRTPKITELEAKRTEDRKMIKALEEKLKTLDPKKNTVEISKIKQERSDAESRINYYNFMILKELEPIKQ